MDPFSAGSIGAAYDAVASDYTARFGDDLEQLPLDREFLDLAVSMTEGDGWIVEAGCGPAPAARHLTGRAAPIVGVDLSLAMLRIAAARNPGLDCVGADVLRLPLRDASCRLVIFYYSLHHLPRAQLRAALAEAARVLGHNGALVVATHLGDGDVVIEEFLGHPIDPIAGCLYLREEFLDAIRGVGFGIDVERERDPLPHEYDSRRLYVIAMKG